MVPVAGESPMVDPTIPNHLSKALDKIERLKSRDVSSTANLLEMIYGRPDCHTILQSFDYPTVVREDDILLLNWALNAVAEAYRAKQAGRLQRGINQAKHRAGYLPHSVIYMGSRDGSYGDQYIYAKQDTRPLGLAAVIEAAEGWHEGDEPLCMLLVDQLPSDPLTGEYHEELDPIIAEALEDLGYLNIQNKIAWNTHSPFWDVILDCFDNDAVSIAAYSRRLAAALISTDYGVLDIQDDMYIQQAYVVSDGKEINTGSDGSGHYHPDHPAFAELIARHGCVAFQITLLNHHTGLFGKGILYPQEQCTIDGRPAIKLDPSQIKGKWAKRAKTVNGKRSTIPITGTLGIIRAWDKPGNGKSCYELLENIEENSPVCDIIDQLVSEATDALAKGGIDKLLTSVVKDDERLMLTAQLLRLSKEELGTEISPMSLPTLASAIEAKFQRKLWHLLQGAGIKGDRYCIVMDATVPRGHCVARGYKPGQKIAGWRFPIVLSQGLKTLKVIEARPHHLVKGECPNYICFMNPLDVLHMQGDDDGDDIYCSPDRRMVELYKHRIDANMEFLIESKGEKFTLDVMSPEGRAYCAHDPQGAVGLYTVMRAACLSMGDLAGARAMSCLVQTAIDQAKRKLRLPHPGMLADINNWWEKSPGVFQAFWTQAERPDVECNNYLDCSSLLAYQKYVSEWHEYRIEALALKHGATEEEAKGVIPCAWREQVDVSGKPIKKQVCLSTMTPAREVNWWQGNLIHYVDLVACREARTKLQDPLEEGVDADLQNLLPDLLQAKGFDWTPPEWTWSEYCMWLRDKSGLREFGAALQKLMKMNTSSNDDGNISDEDDDYGVLKDLREELERKLLLLVDEHGLEALIDIWWFENSTVTDDDLIGPKGKKLPGPNPRHAIRAVCWPGSPVLEILELTEAKCSYWRDYNNINDVVERAMATSKPIETVLNAAFATQGPTPGGNRHVDVISINGQAVPIHACPTCMKVLVDEIIRAIRTSKTHGEFVFVKEFISNTNYALKEAGPRIHPWVLTQKDLRPRKIEKSMEWYYAHVPPIKNEFRAQMLERYLDMLNYECERDRCDSR